MASITIQSIGIKLKEKRTDRGIRDVAKEIGISPATLSRIERGNLPDLETFGKVCRWLDIDPGSILGFTTKEAMTPMQLSCGVHFRKKDAIKPETAQALAVLIQAAQRAYFE